MGGLSEITYLKGFHSEWAIRPSSYLLPPSLEVNQSVNSYIKFIYYSHSHVIVISIY